MFIYFALMLVGGLGIYYGIAIIRRGGLILKIQGFHAIRWCIGINFFNNGDIDSFRIATY
jgi:hypothetical protein